MKLTCMLLSLASVLAAGLGCVAWAQGAPPPTVAEQYLLAAANQERAARGLGPLHREAGLALAAEAHARSMAMHREIAHQFAGEPELTERVAAEGVRFSVVSENVGEAASAVRLHELWMNSEHHRENLLDPKVDSVGIAVVARGGELYAVEDFANSVRSLSLSRQESAIGALVAREGGVSLDEDAASVAAARKTCAMSTGYAGARRPWFVMRFTSDRVTALPEELKSKLASGRFHEAAVGACPGESGAFASYSIAVLLYP